MCYRNKIRTCNKRFKVFCDAVSLSDNIQFYASLSIQFYELVTVSISSGRQDSNLRTGASKAPLYIHLHNFPKWKKPYPIKNRALDLVYFESNIAIPFSILPEYVGVADVDI